MYTLISVLLQLALLCGSLPVSRGTASYNSPQLPAVLTYKELRRAATQTHHRGALTALRDLHFCAVPLKTHQSRFIRVTNPTALPITAQLLLLPNNFEELINIGCPRKAETVFDSEEFEVSEAWVAKCSSDDTEATFAKDQSTTVPPFFPRLHRDMNAAERLLLLLFRYTQPVGELAHSATKMSLLPRLRCGKRCKWELADEKVNGMMLQSAVQGFFLKYREPVVIQPGETVALGPVTFQPSSIGSYGGRVMVRTSAGLHHIINLQGEGQYARLAFRKPPVGRVAGGKLALQELHTLSIDVSADEIERTAIEVENTLRLPPNVKVTRVFEAENVGTIPLVITSIFLDGGVCSLLGVQVQNCEDTRILQPKEVVEVTITYEVSFYQKKADFVLWVMTDGDMFHLPLEVSLHFDELHEYRSLQLLPRSSPAFVLSELCTIVHLCCTIAYLIVVFQEVLGKGPKTSHIVSTRRLASRRGVLVYARLQPPVLREKTPPQPAEKECEEAKPVSPVVIDAPKLDDTQKAKKIKKNKGPILKFSPEQPESAKESPLPQPPVFATNKLLVAKKKKQSDAVDPIETEKRELAFMESRPTAAHSEDGELDDEEYLDEYKMREGLFGGFAGRFA